MRRTSRKSKIILKLKEINREQTDPLPELSVALRANDYVQEFIAIT